MITDFLIVGGGMVGLSVAYQLLERGIAQKIILVEKENRLGLHSSGLNSGVLHAGIYYKPGSLKSKVCVSGAKRLKKWIEERNLPINKCGKIIVPQDENLDEQLDVLFERGKANGADVEMWDETQLKSFLPIARSSTGRALWSPNTVVVNSKLTLNSIENELKKKHVSFFMNQKSWTVNVKERCFKLENGDEIHYSHLINCAGLHADEVAKKFAIGEDYTLFPFKGLYWSIKKSSKIKFNTNLYPVPDLNVPFLGAHFTPTAGDDSILNIGPTATPAFGRENYKGFNNFEPLSTINNLTLLANQYIQNKGGFRKYVHEQSLLAFKPFLLNSAKKLVPSLKSSDLYISKKVGIRAQLYNKKTGSLENDFLTIHDKNSTHILNAISPAFTASFEFADLIIDEIKLS